MHHTDRFDLVGFVLAEPGRDGFGICPAAPIARNELRRQAKPFRHLHPERREMAGLIHQHPIALRESVDQRRFPSAGARRGVDNDLPSLGLEDRLHAVERCLPHRRKIRAAMVDRLRADRPQNTVRHRTWTGNLQKVPTGISRCH